MDRQGSFLCQSHKANLAKEKGKKMVGPRDPSSGTGRVLEARPECPLLLILRTGPD